MKEVYSEPQTALSPTAARIAELSLPARFEEMVEMFPAQVAIDTGKVQITYEQLNGKANAIAQAVLDAGVNSPNIITFFQDNLTAIISLLGVLKARKTCVPVDASHPDERIRRIIEHAQAEIILSEAHLITRAQEFDPASKTHLLDAQDLASNERALNPGIPVGLADPAFIVYTSGSSGEPKGIIRLHQGDAWAVAVDTQDYEIAPSDHLPLLVSYSMGFARATTFNALLNGATVHLRDTDADPVEKWVQSRDFSMIFMVPSMFRYLAHTLSGADNLKSLRYLLLSGEPARSHDFDLFRRHFPAGAILVNRFGLTETGPVARYFLPTDWSEESIRLPVGQILPGVAVRIQSEDGATVPVGEVGEIIVSNPAVGPGYWRNDALTHQKYEHSDGMAWCRTGDLGHFNEDGNLVHLGRNDTQVQIRGFRVETLEVEQVLLKDPAVSQAVVITYENDRGENRLVAYLVPAIERAPSTSELRQALAKVLPDYMIPSTFVTLDALPLTTTGKLDRLALPAPEAVRVDRERHFVAPQDIVEVQLARIWEEVLGVKPVGIRDDFFELGGQSLSAMSMFVRIERKLGKMLPLSTLLQAPTIEQLASILRQDEDEPWLSLAPLQPMGTKPPLYCVHGAGGHLFTYSPLLHSLEPDQPVYGLRAQGLDGKTELHTCVEDMAAHYMQEIQAFQPEGPYYLCGYSYGGIVAFDMARQLSEQGHVVALLVLIDTVLRDQEGNEERNTSEAERLKENFVERIVRVGKRNLNNLHQLSLRESISYVWIRVMRLWQWRVRDRIRAMIRRHHERRAMGNWRLAERVVQIHRQATERYMPQPYAGKVIFFKAAGEPKAYLRLGWSRWAAGGIEFIDLPGIHPAIMKEPVVRVIAEKLTEFLAQAQVEYQTTREKSS